MLSHVNTAFFKVVEYLGAWSASIIQNVFLKTGSADHITFNSKILILPGPLYCKYIETSCYIRQNEKFDSHHIETRIKGLVGAYTNNVRQHRCCHMPSPTYNINPNSELSYHTIIGDMWMWTPRKWLFYSFFFFLIQQFINSYFFSGNEKKKKRLKCQMKEYRDGTYYKMHSLGTQLVSCSYSAGNVEQVVLKSAKF